MSLSAFIWSVLAGILATVFVGATYVIKKKKKNAGIVQKGKKHIGINKSKNVNISIKGDESE
ncbi:hypothetical protein EXW45_23830 [Bacillus wiedmannii]|uniref:hypothetical protein n=1 Tax=Bacillus cereus group TaxID=86661 RepID=UPI0011EFC42B|nr:MULTISPECIES: hypothetical protein [Bacillus cereus group]KAA0795295.1 hypothetical protein DN394_00595 [Bacillus sp. BB081]QWH74211.1 hypothetical protein EXW45_23830 [Bacillus wiedmannii]